jgi:hypothetical protein
MNVNENQSVCHWTRVCNNASSIRRRWKLTNIRKFLHQIEPSQPLSVLVRAYPGLYLSLPKPLPDPTQASWLRRLWLRYWFLNLFWIVLSVVFHIHSRLMYVLHDNWMWESFSFLSQEIIWCFRWSSRRWRKTNVFMYDNSFHMIFLYRSLLWDEHRFSNMW